MNKKFYIEMKRTETNNLVEIISFLTSNRTSFWGTTTRFEKIGVFNKIRCDIRLFTELQFDKTLIKDGDYDVKPNFRYKIKKL